MTSLDELLGGAEQALRRLKSRRAPETLQADKEWVERMRNVRRYDLMGALAEAVRRLDPLDAKNTRLYAQYLIETGKATAAIDLLSPLGARLQPTDRELPEALGVLGRANKQIYFDATNKSAEYAQEALKGALAAYRKGFELNPAKNTWHGVNLIALCAHGQINGASPSPDLDCVAMSKRVVAALEAVPLGERDEWHAATLAEASLGLEDWDAAQSRIRAYLTNESVEAFQLQSTLRQFRDIWGLDSSPEGRGLLRILQARLLELPDAVLEVPTDQLKRQRQQPDPALGQLEAVLGKRGPQTFDWWKTGERRAASVGLVRRRLGGRIGTGFLVRAGALGLDPPDEPVFLTNFHVINQDALGSGIRPQEAEVRFEAADAAPTFSVKEVLWSSPSDLCDATVVRLSEPVTGVEPLPIADGLPSRPTPKSDPRVYVIGYPGGRDLSFSFEDNQLLDHEGPPDGHPPTPGVCRVHYRAPTEGGSSGSPVFNDQWEVIALHHKGGDGMPKLNGLEGTYAANEGVAIRLLARK